MNALRDLRIFSFAALALVGLAGCGAPDQPEAAQQPQEVETVTVAPEAFSLSAELPGRIEPVRVAQVRARVAGIVLRRNFEEGAEIKAGDLLFQIDPAPQGRRITGTGRTGTYRSAVVREPGQGQAL